MRILHVIDQLNAGGAERVCIDLVNVSSQQGLSVGILVLLAESKLDRMVDEKVRIQYLRRESKWSIKKYFEVAAYCREYDIIHIHMRHVYRYMMVVNVLLHSKAKLVLHDHFGDIRIHKQIPFLFGSILKPSFYIGVSTELTRWAVKNLRMDRSRVFLLPNIVLQSTLKSNSDRAGDIVIVSNIRRTKNIGFAIRIAAALHLKLDIIGQLVDEAYYSELKNEIKLLQAETSIRFIHDCYDVQSRLENYRLALHTASSETGPLVLMEYLAQGTTFLAFRTGEVAASLYQMLPDLFVETFDLPVWKDKVAYLMENPVDKTILRSIFQQNFNKEKYFNTCLKIYQSILHS